MFYRESQVMYMWNENNPAKHFWLAVATRVHRRQGAGRGNEIFVAIFLWCFHIVQCEDTLFIAFHWVSVTPKYMPQDVMYFSLLDYAVALQNITFVTYICKYFKGRQVLHIVWFKSQHHW
jgi:hypothetical protein